jgi:hypothetical protein
LHRIAFSVVSEWCQDSVEYSAKVPSQTDLRLLFYNLNYRSSLKVGFPKFVQSRYSRNEHPVLISAALAR